MTKKIVFLFAVLTAMVFNANAQVQAGAGAGAGADTLINYNQGTTAPTGVQISGSTQMTSAKIHNNADAINCIQLKNPYTSDEAYNGNAIILSYEGGFKKGDTLSIAGFFNNSDDTKVAKVDVFTKDAQKQCTVVWTSEQFINGRLVNDDPVVQNYVLTSDLDSLIIGRNGTTATNLSMIKVIRPAAGPDTLNYLHFVSLKDGDTVRLDKADTQRALLTAQLEYSTDNRKTWTAYNWTDNATAQTMYGDTIALAKNDTVWFRAGGTEHKNATFSLGKAEYIFVLGTDDSIAAGGNVMSLYDATCKQDTMTDYGFYYLFKGCKALVTAPELPATQLANSCYMRMFNGCTSLTAAPALNATQLAKYCYKYMFYCCTSLTSAPALPANTLVNECYNGMFYGCTSLTAAPALNATQLAEYCYVLMFSDCTSLTAAPALNATQLAEDCYLTMFKGCTSLTTPPALNATQLAKNCYKQMFMGCRLLNVEEWSESCTGIKMSFPATSATNWNLGMFYGCQGAAASNIELGKNYCVSAQEPTPVSYLSPVYKTANDPTGGIDHWDTLQCTQYLNAMSYPQVINWGMSGQDTWYVVNSNVTISQRAKCEGNVHLILANEDTLTVHSIALTDASSLTIYAQDTAYAKMGVLTCSATSNAAGIGGEIDDNGINITINGGNVTATGAEYAAGIGGGKGGTASGNASNIVINGGYVTATGGVNAAGIGGGMGSSGSAECGNASGIVINGGHVTATGGSEGIAGIGAGLYGTASNIFVANNILLKADSLITPPTTIIPHASTTTDVAASLVGKRYATAEQQAPDTLDYLHFVSLKDNGTVWLLRQGPQYLQLTAQVEYSKDKKSWTTYNWSTGSRNGDTIVLAANDTVWFRAGGTTHKNAIFSKSAMANYRFNFGTNDSIAAGGNVMSLYDATCQQNTMTESGFQGLFNQCKALVTAPVLPATKLATCCYMYMFAYCTSLTTAPALPATELANQCYQSMFTGCTSLNVDTLGASCNGTQMSFPTTSATDWNKTMFNNCHGAYASNIQPGGSYCVSEYIPVITGITTEPYKGTYDGAAHNITVNGTEASDEVTYSTDSANWVASFDRTDVSATKVFVKVARSNYYDYVTSDSIVISKRAITMTSSSDERSYNGEPLTNSTVTVTGDGFVSDENATYTVTGSQTAAGSSQNIFTYSLTNGAKADNYDIDTVYGTLTVNPVHLSSALIEPILNQTYTGDSIKPDINVMYDVMTLVKDSDYTVVYTNNVNVGTATATAIGKGNFTGSDAITFTIDPATITDITTASYKGTYDGAAHNITVSGTVASDEVTYSTDSVTWVASFDRTDVSETKVFVKVARPNYYDYVTADSIVITKRQLTISGTTIATTKEYDGTTDAEVTEVGTLSGVIAGDSVTVSATAAYDDPYVGTNKPVQVAFILSGDKAGNYLAPESITLYADITGTETGMDNMNSDVRIYVIGQELYVEGLTGDYTIYSITGKLLYSGDAAQYTLPQTGNYIVRYQGGATKVQTSR